MHKIIQEFAETIDLKKSKVIKGRLQVTLFGGPTLDPSNPPSQRSIFQLIASKLTDSFIVPESFQSWNHFDMYDDLLSFEEDVCALVDCVIVFLESAGAIAELGCFIKHPNISEKLIVVVSNDLYEKPSFIKFGLIKHLENLEAKEEQKLQVIISESSLLTKEESDFISEKVLERYATLPKTETFRINNVRHIQYLIVDFIDLLQVARISDLQLFLKSAEIDIPRKRLEQMLLTLKSVGLIHEQKVLSERCFFISDKNQPSMEYAFKTPSSKRTSWKVKAFLITDSDKWRRNAFKVLKAKSSQESKEVENVT